MMITQPQIENPVIDARHVRKTFKELVAVKDLSLQIKKGEFVALLGPNGAGKTTLVEMIEGIQKPDSGEILLFGKTWKGNEQPLRQRIGLSLQETHFIDKITVWETLDLFASFFGIKRDRCEEILTLIRLEEKRNSYTANLSGGQRQRLAIGVALLNYPELLLLDEPTTGLDPSARRDLWDIMMKLKETGTTLILTTHYMEEAEYLCDRIVMMNKGEILTQGTLEELLSASGGGEQIEIQTHQPVDLGELAGNPVFMTYHTLENRLVHTFTVTDTPAAVQLLLSKITATDNSIRSLKCTRRTLDDLFIEMTGQHLSEEA
ncbi:MAG: ABC transporter ATP-binding protein [Bacteroidetes bacterium]|nr:ABC transporter ATP-binding protein [Bacteroidota bacterium]